MTDGKPREVEVELVYERSRLEFLRSSAAQAVVSVLLLASSVGVIWLGVQDEQQSECASRYNERKALADQARAEAAEDDQRALETMVRAFVDPPAGDERAALDRYLAALDETNRKRRENPVPAPPPDLCR